MDLHALRSAVNDDCLGIIFSYLPLVPLTRSLWARFMEERRFVHIGAPLFSPHLYAFPKGQYANDEEMAAHAAALCKLVERYHAFLPYTGLRETAKAQWMGRFAVAGTGMDWDALLPIQVW